MFPGSIVKNSDTNVQDSEVPISMQLIQLAFVLVLWVYLFLEASIVADSVSIVSIVVL